MAKKINVTVWNEFRHEKTHAAVKAIYPDGMHATIAKFLSKEPDLNVRTATLDEPDHGLSDKVLAETDVMTWWGHMAHHEVRDEIVAKVHQRVLDGMGLLATFLKLPLKDPIWKLLALTTLRIPKPLPIF